MMAGLVTDQAVEAMAAMRWNEDRLAAPLWCDIKGYDEMKDRRRLEARSSLEEAAQFMWEPQAVLMTLLYILDRRIAKGAIDDPELEAARAALGIPNQYIIAAKES